MTATLIVVTADFRSPDGEVPTGDVTFDLVGTLSDAADLESIAGGQVKAGLDQLGQLVVPLVANDSAGLVPSSSYWVTERINPATERGYYASVPRAPAGSRAVSDAVAVAGSANLSSATAAFTGADVGTYVSCPAFPSPAVVRTVVSGSVVTLSTLAVTTASGLAAVVRASVDLTTLRPL